MHTKLHRFNNNNNKKKKGYEDEKLQNMVEKKNIELTMASKDKMLSKI